MGKNLNKIKVDEGRSRLLIALSLVVIGFLVAALGNYLVNELDWKLWGPTIQGLGYSVITAGVVSYLTDLLLIRTLSEKTEKVFTKVIDKKMPERYKNLKNAGIFDTYPKLKTDLIIKKLDRAVNCDIFILKIWISELEKLIPSLVDAVENRKCSVKILLLDPINNEAIEKRALTIKSMDSKVIQNQIQSNIRIIEIAYKEIEKNRDNFMFKKHSSFVSVSLFGIGGEINMGLYLRDSISSNSFQIRLTGKTRSHYNAVKYHFDEEWKHAEDHVFE